jgi:hypothetical protein
VSGHRITIVGRGAMRGTFAATLEPGGMGKPSMLQDVAARRKTEVERINRAVVMAADTAGIDAPLNRAMLGLIHGLELSRVRPGTLGPGS